MLTLRRFKYQTAAIVLLLLAVHIGMFVLMWMLIAAQRSLLKDLYYISEWEALLNYKTLIMGQRSLLKDCTTSVNVGSPKP